MYAGTNKQFAEHKKYGGQNGRGVHLNSWKRYVNSENKPK